MSTTTVKHAGLIGACVFLAYISPNLLGFGSAVVQLTGISSTVFTVAWDVLFIIVAARVLCGTGAMSGSFSVRSPFWFGVLAAVCMTALIGNLAATVVYSVVGDPSYAAYAARQAAAPTVLSYVLSLVIAPVSEELVMRGVVYGGLRVRFPVVTSAVISAVLFALSHGTLTHLPLTILLAFVSCAAYERSRSIWPSVGCHMLTNFAGLFVIPRITVPVWMLAPVIAGALWILATVGCLALLIAAKREVSPWYDDEMNESTQTA